MEFTIPLEQKVAYLEKTLDKLIQELKCKCYLNQNFEYLTEMEVRKRVDTIIDDFLK